MPSARASKRAGVVDVGDFGDKDVAGAYRRGEAMVDLGTGEPVDLSLQSDIIGGQAPAEPDPPYN